MKLFCLPYAGGSAHRLAATLGPHLAGAGTVALELPGRGARWRENPYADWEAATDDLLPRLAGELDGTGYGLLGHSFGALLGYELAQRMAAAGAPPSFLAVSGRTP